MFEFLPVGRISGPDVDLVLERTVPENVDDDLVPSYEFSVYLAGTDVRVGAVSLRVGFNANIYYAGHIGYRVDEEYRGHHYAAKACLLLKDLALAHGMNELTITCGPENEASRKTCASLGAEWIETVAVPECYDLFDRGETRKCRYVWRLRNGL
jgi:tagatose 1,6-diphosphate aldolase